MIYYISYIIGCGPQDAASRRGVTHEPTLAMQGSRSRRSPRTSHPHAGPGRPWPGVFSKCGSPSAAAMATAYSLPRPGPSCPLPLPHALPSRWPPRPSRRRVPRLLLLVVSLPARLSFWVLENPKRQQQNSFVPLPLHFASYTQFDRCAFRASPGALPPWQYPFLAPRDSSLPSTPPHAKPHCRSSMSTCSNSTAP